MEKEGGGSYNDFRILNLVDGEGHDEEQEMLAMVDNLKEYGKSVASAVVVGGYGAYSVEGDDNYDYYVCRWTDEPYEVLEDGEITVGEETTQVYKGDWVCRGSWLEKLPRAKNWWTAENRPCLVRMQSVLHSSLPLRERSPTNDFSRGTPATTIAHANDHGAWLMSEDDHEYMMMRKRQLAGLDYPDEVFDDVEADVLEEDPDNNDDEEMDDDMDDDIDDEEDDDDDDGSEEDDDDDDDGSEEEEEDSEEEDDI